MRWKRETSYRSIHGIPGWPRVVVAHGISLLRTRKCCCTLPGMSHFAGFHPNLGKRLWLVLLMLVGGVGVLYRLPSESGKSSLAGVTSLPVPAASRMAAPPLAPPPDDQAGVNAGFHQWIDGFTKVPRTGERSAMVAKGLALGRARRARMERMIREAPAQAIAEAISFSEWDALPPEIRAVVEQPFSVTADYHVYPVCAADGQPLPLKTPDHIADFEMAEGRSLEAFTYGKTNELMSKRSLTMQGITLGKQAAIRDGVSQALSGQDLVVARALFPGGQLDETKSYVTGASVGVNAVVAAIGGKLYVFSDAGELSQYDAQISQLNTKPGPIAATSFVALPDAADPSGAIDWSGVVMLASAQASAWTESKKKLLMIRANFPDKLAEPVTQAAAASEINGASSAMILAMSYGKTWVEGTVSANLYTLPQASTYYYNSGVGLNSELLRDARNTFRNNKIGGDATVNIGPISANTTGDGGGLGDYDIVAVFFTSIGMSSGGVTYAGLAGGGNLWVQNANYTSLYTHEWGHNYGLNHASSWGTTDGSVVGAGTSTEYGDIYDVMGSGPAPQGHYHPQGKVKLNWLTASQWSDATAAGSNIYRVFREDDATTTGDPRGVRVTKVATPGSEEYYWIGYKPAFSTNPHLARGVYLTWQQAGQSRCWLIDTTPGSADGKTDAAVDLGRTYIDTAAGVFITPLASGGVGANSYLDVQVNVGSYPTNHAPTANAITGPSTVAARTLANFSVTAADVDGDPLAYCWNAVDGTVNDNAAGFTHLWEVGGTYTLSVTVTDMKGGSVTVSKIVTVTDPIDTWTLQSTGTTGDLQDVVWGQGRFVAAEYWGGVFTSWDGVAWSNVGKPSAFESQPRLAFGNQVFVMAGKKTNVAAAQISYSADARIWKSATFPAGVPVIQEVAFGNGKFLAVADSGSVLSSADGITWSLITVAGSPNFRHITWDGSVWVAVAMNAAQSRPEVVWTSLDGISWSQHNSLGFDVNRIYGIGGMVFALGWYGGVMCTNDHGVTWSAAITPGSTRWSTFRMAISDVGTLLVVARAMDESGSPNALLVSSDGFHWSRSTANSGNTAVGNANGLVFGAGSFLTVENAGVARSCANFYPTNAAPAPVFTVAPATTAARQVVALAAAASDANGDALVYSWDFGPQFPLIDGAAIAPRFDFGGSFLVTLRVSDSHGGLTAISYTLVVTDPVRTFIQRSSGTNATLNAIAANSSVAVAVGGSGGIILTSTDGVTWVPRSAPSATNKYFYAITWDGARFIAVGMDYDFTLGAWVGTICTSPDGITWAQSYNSPVANTRLSGVASDGAGAVAVGENGSVIVSSNGTSWSSVAVAGVSATNLTGVAWNGSVYAMVGYGGSNGSPKVLTSVDRTNWFDFSAGTGVDTSWQDLRKIAWLNDRFVSSGWYSSLRVSSDNAQTFGTTRAVVEDTPAMAFGDGIYFAAGVDRSAGGAAVDVLSRDGLGWYGLVAPTATQRNGAVFFKHTFITVGASGEIWQSANTTPAGGFVAWQNARFPGGGVIALPTSDADNDGVPNLIEYALSRNPNLAASSDGSSGAGGIVIAAGVPWIHLELPDPAMPDVTYEVQGSTTLVGVWTSLARKSGAAAWMWLADGPARISEGISASGRRPVEVGMPVSAGGQARYFLRLQATGP